MARTDKLTPSTFETKWPRTILTSSPRLNRGIRGADIRGKQSFNPGLYESKWRTLWERHGVYQPDIKNVKKPLDKARGKPFYNLMMFPYPSAEGLHVGNMYAFTGADIYGRFMRMQGHNVFEPIGLDGFGIHSENYALKTGRHPAQQAKISEKNFYRQLHSIGNGFAWRNTLETYDPDYYRWTQWIFVIMFKAGLAYRKKSPVNFCPSCKTVLADEQVIEGACERCKSIVEKRQMEQWYFKITKYADRLLENLDKLDWTDKVKIAQRNWIGKKEGINIKYQVLGTKERIECFTTRPDTNFGATFVVIAPEHPLVDKLLDLKTPGRCSEGTPSGWTFRMNPSRWRDLQREIKDYIEKAKKKTPAERIAEGREKTGVFTGFYCLNQLNNYKMPLFISDFVLMEFGTGAVVGVPGHDKRDFEFAQKFNLPVIRVVVGKDGDSSPIQRIEQVQEEEGTMINSGFLNGLDIHLATQKMMDYIEEKSWGKRVTTFHLRDWCISRQRYWGPPIPMIYCEKCASEGKSWFTTKEARQFKAQNPKFEILNKFKIQNLKSQNSFESGAFWAYSNFEFPAMAGWYPVPEEDLPVQLPFIQDYRPAGTGVSPLSSHKEFHEVACPKCGSVARRETDVSDTFLDSAWYFLRYPSVGIQNSKIKNQKYRLRGEDKNFARPAPKGERATMRLWTTSNSIRERLADSQKHLSDLSGDPLEQLPWNPEITRKWLPVNMYIGGAEHSVLHLLYSRFITMALHDFGYLHFEEPFTRFYAHGLIICEGAKMSKSKGNIVIPDEYIRKYGSDALRTYLMFIGPFNQGGDFRDTGIAGMYRFLGRVWRLVNEYLELRIKNKELRSDVSDDSKAKNTPRTVIASDAGSSEVEKSESLTRFMHKTIKNVADDLINLRYNTAIAHIMEFVNELQKFEIRNSKFEIAKVLLLLLAPFAPHMTEELWSRITLTSSRRLPASRSRGARIQDKQQDYNYNSIHLHPWPSYNPKYLMEEEVTIVVQVNGKLRETIRIKDQESRIKDEVETEAKKSERVQKYLAGKKILKTIFVPGRLINFVV